MNRSKTLRGLGGMVGCGVLLLAATLLLPGSVLAKSVTVAVVQDGASAYLERRIEGVIEELENIAGPDFTFTFKRSPRFSAHWDGGRAPAALERALADPDVDLVYAAGFLVTEAAVSFPGELEKPVVSGVAHDSDLLGLTGDPSGYSPKRNLAFISIPGNVMDDIDGFKRLVGFRTLHVLVDGKIAEFSPHAADYVDRIAETYHIRVAVVPVDDMADPVLGRLSGAEAVYITPLFRMADGEIGKIVDGVNRMKIPSFSMLGRPQVELGVLAGRLPAVEGRIRRRIALNMHQILLGESPNRLHVGLALPARLLLNMETARKIGFEPPVAMLIEEVEWVGSLEESRGDALTLEEAMITAAENNIEVSIADDRVAAAAGARDRAASGLLPQVYASSRYRVIDSDRARSALGSEPEYLTTLGASLRQVLYDDGIFTGVKTADLRLSAAADARESIRMDRMADAGARFLECLSALAIHRIEQDNLAVTEKNLRLARVRHKVGRAGPEEILRWEAEEAQRRGEVISAKQAVEIAFVALNQSMGVGQEGRWRPRDIEIGEGESYLLGNRIHRLVSRLGDIKRLEAHSVAVALENAPEMVRLEKEIGARKLELARLKRRYYVPVVTAGAGYTHRADESGDGEILFVPLFGMPTYFLISAR